MPVPFGSLIAQRPRVLPQTGQILGRLGQGFATGYDAGQQRGAEDAAPDLLLNYLDSQAANRPATLGSLVQPATGYVGGQGQAPAARVPFDGRPTRENAAANPVAPRSGVDAGVQYLDQFEGFQPTPYPDWSYRAGTGERYLSGYRIGYGQDANGMPGQVDEQQAQQALRQQIETQYIPSIVNTIGGDRWAALNADQQGVLISLVHNYGSLPNRILDELATGDANAAAQAIAALAGDNQGINRGRRETEAMAFAGTGQPMAGGGGGSPAAPSGGGYASAPVWTPPSPQERAQLRALMLNPATRQQGFELAVARMANPANMPADPVVINDRLVNRNTGAVMGDYRTGAVWQDATVGGMAGQRNVQTGEFNPYPVSTQPTNAPDVRNLIGPDGQLHAMAWNPATQRYDSDMGLADPGGQFSATVGPDGTVQITQGRQGTTAGATEGQANANIYATRMEAASPLIDQFTTSGQNFWSGLVSGLGVVGNIALSQIDPQYQQFAQATRDFINASLRRESGAVISPEEFRNAQQQYIPQPGDTPDTLEQKRQNRARQTEAIRQASGPFADQGGGATQDAPPAIDAPRVATPQDYEALAPGTQYYDPDGNLRTKQ